LGLASPLKIVFLSLLALVMQGTGAIAKSALTTVAKMAIRKTSLYAHKSIID
jgi:Na+-transporting methylmalonyl-CoA/oxaloacetate decarboxylase gamma subunit